nr:MAG TPA: hypothetical protein [Caudoviricetes sp.]DAX89090.1 MAG TPA: hypothetical protein [Caudoviricetes sp.]
MNLSFLIKNCYNGKHSCYFRSSKIYSNAYR